MSDKEKISRIASKLRGKRELLNRFRCGGKKFYAGGDKEDTDKSWQEELSGAGMYQPSGLSVVPQEVVNPVPLRMAEYKEDHFGDGYIPGFSNIDRLVREGDPYYSADGAEAALASRGVKIYRNRDTGEFFEYAPSVNPMVNLSNYEEVPYSELRKAMPKKDYIGGKDYRLTTVKRVPGLLDAIRKKAEAYGIDPNLLLHRFMREGLVDQWVREYNDSFPSRQRTYFSDVWDTPVSGFSSLGLDDAGNALMKGLYTLKDPAATWETEEGENEKGRRVVSVNTPDLNSALEIKAADMAYRQNELAKRGLRGNAYVNAAYNMGLYHDDLNNADFVSRRYAVPDYGVFGDGGKIYDGNTEPTGQMERVPQWRVRGTDYSMWSPQDIQDIIGWGIQNPEQFFESEGEATRDALSRAGMTNIIEDIYAGASPYLTPAQKAKWSRYKGAAQKQSEYQQGVTDAISGAGQNIFNAADRVAGWLPGPVGTVNWLGHTFADIADGNWGKVAGDAAMVGVMGGLGKGASWLGNQLMGKYSGLRNFGEKAGNFLDDMTWNDARRSQAADAWSRNLDTRQRWGFVSGDVQPVEGGSGITSVVSGYPDYENIDHDTVHHGLLDRWLFDNNRQVYDRLQAERRLEESRDLLRSIEFTDPASVSQSVRTAMMNGNYDWDYHSQMGTLPSWKAKLGYDDMDLRIRMGRFNEYKPHLGGGTDVPLSVDLSPFTSRFDRLAKVRDTSYDLLLQAAKEGKLSPLGYPIAVEKNSFEIPSVTGTAAIDTTPSRIVKPYVHFMPMPLLKSGLDSRAAHPYIGFGANELLGARTPIDLKEMVLTHYKQPLWFSPEFVMAHETAHVHPGFNNHYGETPAGQNWPTLFSKHYANSYWGIQPKVRQMMKPRIDEVQKTFPTYEASLHDKELSESFSDIHAFRTLMNLYGINDGMSGVPYDEKQVELLNSFLPDPTRFNFHFPGVPLQTWLLNNAWKDGGQMNQLAGGGKFITTGNASKSQKAEEESEEDDTGLMDMYLNLARQMSVLPWQEEIQPVLKPESSPISRAVYSEPASYSSEGVPIYYGEYQVSGVPVPMSEQGYAEALMSEASKQERALRQRYAESAFNDRAVSGAGAVGAYQIMPITKKDYLTRGKGKPGDLNDPKYSRTIRDYVLGIIPKDLGEFWSDSDPADVRLAKMYAAYNWGAGNLRKYLRKQSAAGKDVATLSWMSGLPKETRDYVNWIVFGQDIQGTGKTKDKFERAAKKRGYMAEGGPIHVFDGDTEPTGQMEHGYDWLTENASRYGVNVAPTVSSEAVVSQTAAPAPYTEQGYREKTWYEDPVNRRTYSVVPGDTMWGIAQREGIPLQGLLRMNPSVGDGSKIRVGQRISLGYKPMPKQVSSEPVQSQGEDRIYKVQKGDYLGKIAKDNGMTLKQLVALNPQFKGRESNISIGERVNLGKKPVERSGPQFSTLRERREWEAGLDNIGAIQNYKHEKNYAIVDKDAQTLTVYSPDNKVIKRMHVNTGKSNEDYNTKTYERSDGHLLYGQGNMSTPAGITEIVSIGPAYGHTSYVRARVGNDGNVREVRDKDGNLVTDTIASSMHYEKGLQGPNASNGCIRLSGKDADALKDYLGVGSRVYTLPQSKDEDGNASSWFKLEDGKLSFYAKDPVGQTDNESIKPVPLYENGKIKRDKDGNIMYRDFASEDDYNQSVDMTASPLHSSYNPDDYKKGWLESVGLTTKNTYERNRAVFTSEIADNKSSWMKEFIDNGIGVNSDTYNMLAELAVAIANQESGFGTGHKFRVKSAHPGTVEAMKGKDEALSIGITQMKYDGYNDEAKRILKNLGINVSSDKKSQRDLANSAKATMALLSYFYNEQLTPMHRRKLNAAGMSDQEALAMMFNGKSVAWLEKLVSKPGWEKEVRKIAKFPGGIGVNLPFDLGKKEVLATDYANKADNYLHQNESFHLADGGLIERMSSVYKNDRDAIRQAIQNARLKQKK